jgi:hypothetical protein
VGELSEFMLVNLWEGLWPLGSVSVSMPFRGFVRPTDGLRPPTAEAAAVGSPP